MNQLKVNQQETIVTLWNRGWSARRIAREMGYDRDTVTKYFRLEEAKPATPTAGSDESGEAKPVVAGREDTTTPAVDAGTAGSGKPVVPRREDTTTPAVDASMAGSAKPVVANRAAMTTSAVDVGPPRNPEPATPTSGASTAADANKTGEAGDGAELCKQALAAARANVSLCVNWKQEIEAGLEQGLSAKRIHQDLVRDRGFAGSYQSVKRFVRKLEQAAPVPFRRMDFAPGLGSLMSTASDDDRRSFAPCSPARAKAIARRPSTRRPRRFCAAWKTRIATVGVFPSPRPPTISRRPCCIRTGTIRNSIQNWPRSRSIMVR